MGLRDVFRMIFHGFGRTPDDLRAWLDMGTDHFADFQPIYSSFRIPKRSGGTRIIHAPDKLTAKAQRLILYRLLAKLPVHPCATGFRPGMSIVDNARPHVGKDVVVRMDIRDFFPATRSKKIIRSMRRLGWNRPAAKWIANACTIDGRLPQGAPTSPALSNIVNYRLDARLHGLANAMGADYTRYADDITFSVSQAAYEEAMANGRGRLDIRSNTMIVPYAYDFSGIPRILVHSTRHILEDEGYKANRKKTRILRQHQRQMVTGIIVNEKLNIPRETRRRLRAIRHQLKTRGDCTMSTDQLAGWEGYERMVACNAENE